ncbi:MAG: GNAT family N-acetyltransferase [Bryobacteraceae bacterium]
MTANDVVIAPAREEDFEWCASLMASSEPWLTLGRGLADCRERCRHPEYVLLVARSEGRAIGFCNLHPRGLAGSPYIAVIAVGEAHRGRGIGAALLAYAERQFPASRYIFLCVSSFNIHARRLYERLGYTILCELKDYIIDGASEILMQKRLTRE